MKKDRPVLVALFLIISLAGASNLYSQEKINDQYQALFIERLKALGVKVHVVEPHPKQRGVQIVRFGSEKFHRFTSRLLLRGPESTLDQELEKWLYYLLYSTHMPVKKNNDLESEFGYLDSTKTYAALDHQNNHKTQDVRLARFDEKLDEIHKLEQLKLVFLIRHAERYAKSGGKIKTNLSRKEKLLCTVIENVPDLPFSDDDSPVIFLQKISPKSPKVSKALELMFRGKIHIQSIEQLAGQNHYRIKLISTSRGYWPFWGLQKNDAASFYDAVKFEVSIQTTNDIDKLKNAYGFEAIKQLVSQGVTVNAVMQAVTEDRYDLTHGEKTIFLRNMNAFAEILRIAIIIASYDKW